MSTLFPVEFAYPEGFFYSPDFLTENEELKLYKEITKIDLHSFNFQGYEAKRKVASFGYDYRFENGRLTKGKSIPPTFDFLIEKVSKHLSVSQGEFAELLVPESPVGSVITWHR